MGDLPQIPHWVRSISPFDHIPLLPAEPMQWLPIVVLTAIGAFRPGLDWLGYGAATSAEILISGALGQRQADLGFMVVNDRVARRVLRRCRW